MPIQTLWDPNSDFQTGCGYPTQCNMKCSRIDFQTDGGNPTQCNMNCHKPQHSIDTRPTLRLPDTNLIFASSFPPWDQTVRGNPAH
eukprot:3130096-Amphidinium_carterae.1